MPSDRCVDLFGLRTAVAALYWARHHLDDLDSGAMRRLDAAVAHLAAVHDGFAGELGAACRALLSSAADPGGARCVRAIDRLAELTHVDDDSAAALASLVDDDVRYNPCTPSLFDLEPEPDPAEAADG